MTAMRGNEGKGIDCELAVLLCDGADRSEAADLATRLGIPLVDEEPEEFEGLVLRCDADGLTLMGGGMEMRGDFTRLLPRLQPANLAHELLVRAAKGKSIRTDNVAPLAVDATAGMGEDSLLLAAAGFRVVMFEHNPIVAALLRDAMHRALLVPELAPVVARMELRETESLDELPRMAQGAAPDVVLLDPMFPARTKSASVKKKAQLLQCLERPCPDEAALLDAALAAHPRRIVVKRPPKGPYLAGVKPAYSLEGKAVRYDCLVPPPR